MVNEGFLGSSSWKSVQDVIFTLLFDMLVNPSDHQVPTLERSIDFPVCEIFTDDGLDRREIQGLQLLYECPGKLIHDEIFVLLVILVIDEFFGEFFGGPECPAMVDEDQPPVFGDEVVSPVAVYIGNQIIEGTLEAQFSNEVGVLDPLSLKLLINNTLKILPIFHP